MLRVSGLSLSGEGSATAYYELMLPALEASTGQLSAMIVWAGGDSVVLLNVTDGEVTETTL